MGDLVLHRNLDRQENLLQNLVVGVLCQQSVKRQVFLEIGLGILLPAPELFQRIDDLGEIFVFGMSGNLLNDVCLQKFSNLQEVLQVGVVMGNAEPTVE